jgi:hypothetical protein
MASDVFERREKSMGDARASMTLQVRKVKKLPSGEYNVQVSLVSTHLSGADVPASDAILESVTLPAGTKNIARLEDPHFVDEGANAWFASRGGKWDKVNIQKYLEHILKKKP